MTLYRDFLRWAQHYAVPDECQFCGNPTDWHRSATCLEHRDLAPPIPGLDEPYPDELVSEADGPGSLPSGSLDRRKRPDPAARPAGQLDRGQP